MLMRRQRQLRRSHLQWKEVEVVRLQRQLLELLILHVDDLRLGLVERGVSLV